VLQALGARLIINISDADWREKLTTMCHENETTVGFDAIAGEITGQVLSCMPRGSELQVYGGLSEQACSNINPSELIFRGKTVTGFWLQSLMASKGMLAQKGMVDRVMKHLKECFAPTIKKSFSLGQYNTALKEYTANMGDGKIVFKMSPNPRVVILGASG
jgi:NADPH2:quinone reductase